MTKRMLCFCVFAVVFAAQTGRPTIVAATIEPAERCGRAVVTGSNQIVRADVRTLSRCVLAVLEPLSELEIEEACSKLRTPGLRVDRVDGLVRDRILRRCTGDLPGWLPSICRGPGPAAGRPASDADALSHCTTTAGHCTALRSLDLVFRDPISPLMDQNADNLEYRFGGIDDNSFSACLGDTVPTTSTTTTTLTTSTTTLPTPTTTTTTTTTSLPPTQVSLVITEIMPNPAAQSDAAGEYFEVLNAGNASVDLLGLVVQDLGSDSFTVSESVVIPPAGRAVFGKSTTAAGGLVDHAYGSGMNLTNSADAIILVFGGQVLDQVTYDAAFPLLAGRSMEVAAAAETPTANDSPAAWCGSDSALGDGDFGTPRAPAGACAP